MKPKKRTARKTTKLPEHLSEDVRLSLEDTLNDADKYHALKTIFDQDGGQILVDSLIDDVVSSIERLENYAELSRDQMVSLVARMTTSLNLARALTRAEENHRLADEALKDALRT